MTIIVIQNRTDRFSQSWYSFLEREGVQIMNTDVNDELLRSFVEKAAGHVNQQAEWNQELGCFLLDSKNWGFLAVKMHHYFFIARDDAATVSDFDEYVHACVDWGLRNYKGLPRGMQKGVAFHPVLLQSNPSPEVIAYTKQKPDAHWAAFVLPTAVDLTSGSVDYMEKTPIWGYAMWKGIREVSDEVLKG